MSELFAGMVDALEEIAEKEKNEAAMEKVKNIRKKYGLNESLNESPDPEQAYSSALSEIENKLAEIKLSLRMMYRLQKEVEVTWDDVGTLNSIKEKLNNAKEESERFSDYIRVLL